MEIHRDVETGVCVTDRGFKRNLTQSTGKYDYILVHFYVLLNHFPPPVYKSRTSLAKSFAFTKTPKEMLFL